MHPPEKAWSLIAAHLRPLPAERVERREAYGRVLAAPLAATVDVPPADVSAMDGYAVASPLEAGERRPVTGTVAAGDAPGFALAEGAAARIMTGAPMPAGADTVVPIEKTDGGESEVLFEAPAARGDNVRRRAEILRAGQPLLSAGRLLTPGALALIATHGHDPIPVHRRPRVAVLATGDEVVPPEVEPGPGQLRDSHTDFLLAAGRGLGLELESLGIAPDRREAIQAKVREGLKRDLLLVCGGVSKGEYDYVEEILSEAGCELVFGSVAVQPGKPLVAARHPGGWVFGLPGNPASVMVTFWLFVKPLLRRLMGLDDGFWRGALAGVLAGCLPAAGPRDRFLPAEVTEEEGVLTVLPVIPKGSHDLAAYGRGTALVRVPAGAPAAKAGDRCEVLLVARG